MASPRPSSLASSTRRAPRLPRTCGSTTATRTAAWHRASYPRQI
jgi:hypothetical protein